jgi:TolA-binding protein
LPACIVSEAALRRQRLRRYDSAAKIRELSARHASSPAGSNVMRFVLLSFLVLQFAVGPGARAAEPDAAFAAAAEHYRAGEWQQAADGFAALVKHDAGASRALEAQFFHGEALAQLGRWQEALPDFVHVLESAPDGPHARQSLFRAGEAAYMTADDGLAQKYLSSFRDQFGDDPLNAFALTYLGNLELQARHIDEAEKMFSGVLQRFPEGPMALESQFGLAQSWQQAGKLEQARDLYRQVVQQGGELLEPALVQLGSTENSLGSYEQALATFKQFAARFPGSSLTDKSQLGQGYSLHKLGRNADAQAILAPLSSKPEMQVDAADLLGLSQAAEQQWDAAAETLKGISLDDAHELAPAIAYHAADALLRAGKSEEATQEFNRVLEKFANSAWADDSLLGKTQLAIQQKDAAACLQLADDLLAKFPDSPLAAQAKLAKGQALAALDKPQEAATALQSLVDSAAASDPAAAELRERAQSLLAMSRAKLGQFDEAKQAVNQLAASAKDGNLTDDLKVRVGELAQAAGKTDVAQELLAGAAQGTEQVADRARAGLAWSQFEAGRWQEAAIAFQQVLDANPTGPQAAEAALLRGRALEHLEQYDDALAMYTQVADRYPDASRAAESLLRAGRLNEQLGHLEQARNQYAAILEKYPDFAGLDDAIFHYAELQSERDPEASEILLERLRSEFATSPLAAEATLRLANRAVAAKRFDDASTLLREVTRPDAAATIRPQALYLEGRLELSRGEWTAAEKPLGQLIGEHPDSDLVLPAEYLLAEAAFRAGDFQRSLERLNALREKTRENSAPWVATAELRRAQSLAQLHRWSEASEAAQALQQRFPQFAQSHEADYIVGRAFAAQADFDAAREWYAREIAAPAAAGSETAAMAQWMIGESYFHQEQYEHALSEYQKVGEGFPRWHSAALLQAGKAQESLGRWQAASELYQQLIDRYPDGQLHAEAVQRLGAAQQRAANSPSPATALQ